MPEVTARQKSVASEQEVTALGMSMQVDLVPVRKPGLDKTGFVIICPACETGRDADTEPTLVSQQYTCGEQHGPYTLDELPLRAKEVDGKLVPITEEERENSTLPVLDPGRITFRVYPRADVARHTRVDDVAYRLRPCWDAKKKTSKTDLTKYAVIRSLAASDKYALVGELVMRGKQRPYLLEVWHDQLVMQSLVRPDHLADTETIEQDVDPAVVEKAHELAEALVQPFDVDEFRDLRAEAIARLVEAKAADPNATAPVAVDTSVAEQQATNDLLALLTASVAQAKKTDSDGETPAKAKRARKAKAA